MNPVSGCLRHCGNKMRSGLTAESAGLPFSLKALMLGQGPSGHNKPFLLDVEGTIWDDPGGIYHSF